MRATLLTRFMVRRDGNTAASCGLAATSYAAVCILLLIGCEEDDAAGARDAGRELDAGEVARDASTPDSGGLTLDGSMVDATMPMTDATIVDATVPTSDAGPDAHAADAGFDAADPDLDGGHEPGAVSAPGTLEETGLFKPGSLTELADGVVSYTPAHVLWSDGAEKRRWLYVPAGSRIDTSEMDYWRFPEGTKAWKEFSRDGKKIETRLLWKSSAGWFTMAFAWNDAETEAIAVPGGVVDARGTPHDIPESGACRTCHDGAADMLLGVSAIQLSHDGPGLTLQSLASAGVLSNLPSGTDYRLPAGDDWRALGYLHANCGTCHNPNGVAFDRADGMQLWLTVESVAGPITATPTYATTVGVALSASISGFNSRIVAGSADESALVHRMEVPRGDDLAMPPLATELVDTPNVNLVRAWIDGL